MSKFTEMMKNRRSIYALGENLPISKEEVTALVTTCCVLIRRCSQKIMGND